MSNELKYDNNDIIQRISIEKLQKGKNGNTGFEISNLKCTRYVQQQIGNVPLPPKWVN